MPRRKSKAPEDEVQSAKRVFDTLIARSETVHESVISLVMSEMGKRGGSKGGKMRLVTMTPERRSEVAKLAANKRWATKRKKIKA